MSGHLNCAQTLLRDYAHRCGVSSEEAVSMGALLGHGFYREGTCGLIIAALIVLGMGGRSKDGEAFLDAIGRCGRALTCPEVMASKGGCGGLADAVRCALDQRLGAA